MENQVISQTTDVNSQVKIVEEDYEKALEADKEFSVLKKLKEQIRHLQQIQQDNEDTKNNISAV